MIFVILVNGQISVMVLPSLQRIRFDRQIFRMLLINAISTALRSIDELVRGSTTSAAAENPGDAKEDAAEATCANSVRERDCEPLDGVVSESDVHEILIQIGESSPTWNEDVQLMRDVFYSFLKPKHASSLASFDISKSWVTVAVVDGGRSCPFSNNSAAYNKANSISKKIVENLGGFYEKEVQPWQDNSGRKYNITRYSLPYEAANEAEWHPYPVTEQQDYPERIMWKSPSTLPYCGFEHPGSYVKYLWNIYESRLGMETDDGVLSLTSRRMLIVHHNAVIVETFTSVFALGDWTYQVVPTLNSVITFAELYRQDAIVLCGSNCVLSPLETMNMFKPEVLAYLGFHGALILITDISVPDSSPLSNYFHLKIDIPILDASVKKANTVADKALIDYILEIRQQSSS
jgi:hypothetical protein